MPSAIITERMLGPRIATIAEGEHESRQGKQDIDEAHQDFIGQTRLPYPATIPQGTPIDERDETRSDTGRKRRAATPNEPWPTCPCPGNRCRGCGRSWDSD